MAGTPSLSRTATHEAVGRYQEEPAGRYLIRARIMATWLNPRTGVIHAVAENGFKTVCGFVRLWLARGRIDPAGRFSEEYVEEVERDFGGPWTLCCHCRERGAEDRINMIHKMSH